MSLNHGKTKKWRSHRSININPHQAAVIKELIDTETAYIKKLRIGIKVCEHKFINVNPSKPLSIPYPVRGRANTSALFGNYREIYFFHFGVFRKELLSRQTNLTSLANCFIKRKEELTRLYSSYCRNQPKSKKVLESLKEYPKFLKKYQAKLKSQLKKKFGPGSGNDPSLASFLILPVQRCTKYILLLQILLNNTDPENITQRKVLEDAVCSMNEVLMAVNSSMQTSTPQQMNNTTPQMPSPVSMKKEVQKAAKTVQKRGSAFGVDLHTLTENTNSNVPYIVRTLCEDIEKKFKHIKDFYTSKEHAPAAKVDCLRVKFEVNYRKKKDINLSTDNSPFVHRALLQQFFSELPGSLIPGDIYKDIITIAMDEHYSQDKRTAITELTELLGCKLPHGPYTRTLNFLLRHLDHMKNDRVDVQTLAYEWVPHLIKDPDALFPMTRDCLDYGLLTRVLELLIIHRKNILWRGKSGLVKNNFVSGFLTSQTYISSDDDQKYFCVPFKHRDDSHNMYRNDGTVRKGWFFIHFDGAKTKRQIEFHPGKAPLLFLAGQNDDALCKLSLHESNLLTRRNAEISSWDFNSTWRKYGGDTLYLLD